MKESIAEYARIVILLLCFIALCYFVLGGAWFGDLGTSADNLQHEVVNNRQQNLLDELDNRQPPSLTLIQSSFNKGDVIPLLNIIKAKDIDGIDLRGELKINFKHEQYDETKKVFTPTETGAYQIKAEVTDSFGLHTKKIFTIIVYP